MADEKKKIHTVPADVSVIRTVPAPIDTEEYDTAEEAVAPLVEIGKQLRFVAEGGSAAILHTTVQRVMPRDKAEARKLFNQLTRMSQATDVAVRAAAEVMSALEN
jgi:hypothetical protein